MQSPLWCLPLLTAVLCQVSAHFLTAQLESDKTLTFSTLWVPRVASVSTPGTDWTPGCVTGRLLPRECSPPLCLSLDLMFPLHSQWPESQEPCKRHCPLPALLLLLSSWQLHSPQCVTVLSSCLSPLQGVWAYCEQRLAKASLNRPVPMFNCISHVIWGRALYPLCLDLSSYILTDLLRWPSSHPLWLWVPSCHCPSLCPLQCTNFYPPCVPVSQGYSHSLLRKPRVILSNAPGQRAAVVCCSFHSKHGCGGSLLLLWVPHSWCHRPETTRSLYNSYVCL